MGRSQWKASSAMSDDAKELRAVFLEEADELVQDIERDLLELEASPGNHTLVRVELETNRHDVRFGSGAHDNAVFWCGNPKVHVENDAETFQDLVPNNRVFRTTEWLMGTKL